MDSLLPKSKVCSKCGEEKLLEEFHKHKMGKYGRASRCKLCIKQYQQDNKEEIIKYNKANKEKRAEYQKQYRKANGEKISKRGKQYYKKNIQKIKQYYEANKEELAGRQIEKMKYLTENDLLPKSRVCTKCGDEKLLGEFHKNKMGKYGRTSHCKLCNIKKEKQYRKANKEKISEREKKYREANKERIAEYQKQYHKENKERYKQYYQENKQKTAERRKQYYEANKERTNEHVKTRRKNDEQFRIRTRISANLRYVLNKIEKTKNASILTYIGCSIEFMQEHLNSTKKPDWGDDLHIDHIIPCASFDHTNEEEVKKCWNWRNLRYLPAEENKSKQDKLDMDLVKSYGIEDLLPVGVDK